MTQKKDPNPTLLPKHRTATSSPNSPTKVLQRCAGSRTIASHTQTAKRMAINCKRRGRTQNRTGVTGTLV